MKPLAENDHPLRIDLAGDGQLVVIGGAGNDTIDASGWQQGMVAFGDEAELTQVAGKLIAATSVHPEISGADTLIGGHGNDILVGGGGNDTFYGNLRSDLLVGEGGSFTLRDGRVQSLTVSR